MAAESDFASTLIDSLKVELPWLPPSSWESIPSESGHRLHRPLSSSEHRPRPQPTSVSEESMVRLAMNALQGVESSLISIEKISSTFCSEPSDRTFHQIPSLWNRCSSTQAQGKLLKSIGRLGFLVFLLSRFVDHFTDSNLDKKILGISKYENPKESEVQEENHPPHSLVNHAFAVAVGKIIEGYVCALDSLYPSVHLRRSSENVECTLEVQRIGCLRSVVHSETTLLELYLHTKELRTQIEALGNICNLCTVASRFTETSFTDIMASSLLEFHSFFRGGDLLTYLYTQLQVADPPHRAVLRFLFLHSCEPYCGFITSWIYKADISDPYKEFVVEHDDASPLSQHGKADMPSNFPMGSIKVRDGVALPCFLSDYVVPLVRAGQQLQVLMKLLECCSFASSEDLTYEDLLPNWNGFLNNHSANAFPITFDKEEIEAMELKRGCYYEKMHAKLENLLTKLEFRYHQVISHDTTPNGFAYGWKSSSSFKLGNISLPPLAEEKGTGDDRNSENSSMMDDLLESSECSSTTNSEEGILSDQLIDLSGHATELEQKYLSALSFSNHPLCSNVQQKPNEYGELPNAERDPDGIFEGRANCRDQKPQSNDSFLRQIFMPIESQEPDRSVNDLWESSTHVNAVYRDNLRSSPGDSHRRERKFGALKEGISYYRKLLVTEHTLAEDSYGKQQENDTDLFTLRDLKVTSDVNFLGLNPMLTRNTFLELQTDHGEKNGIHGHSLPYFDFTSVNDCKRCYLDFSSVKDCKRTSEKHSVGSMDSSAKAPIIKNCPSDKHKHGQDTLIRRTEALEFNSLQEPKDRKDGDAVPPLISGGSSWESSLAKSANIIINSSEDHRETSPAKFDIPLDFIIDKCLQQEIMLQYKYVSKLTIKLLEEGFDFKQHLLALRRYHFMELADWADLFIISLSTHKWCITEAERRLAEIQGFLELSIQRSSCEFDHNKDRLYVYLKGKDAMPLTTSSIGLHSFDFLGLGYRVDWPVSIVLTAGALKVYSEIFSFLIKVKIAIFSLTDVWSSLKELRPLTSRNQHVEQHDKEVHHFNLLIKMRHQVNHFVATLQQYVESQLSHVSWCRFIHSLQHKVKDMMDLESVHMSYLIDSLHICFLSEETRHIAKIIDRVLQCALDFRVCLRGVMQDHDETLRLSRINISQVFSIKKTFDKNLQELYLYYFKSPKHGNYGLSRFWGYLNYNEHYSDIGNMRRFN